jgi:hypothetical protein
MQKLHIFAYIQYPPLQQAFNNVASKETFDNYIIIEEEKNHKTSFFRSFLTIRQ